MFALSAARASWLWLCSENMSRATWPTPCFAPRMTRRISAITSLAVALALLAGPVACVRRVRVDGAQQAGSDYYTPAPTTVLFAHPQQPELIRSAVVRAMAEHGYAAESDQPGQIIARYTRGRIDLRVQIQYQPSQAVITYLGSEGLRIDRAGRARHYERWVQQLSSTMQHHVAQIARRPTTYIVQQQQPQVIYVQQAPQPVVVAPPQGVVVQAAPPTVIVQEPSSTMVVEGSIGGASMQGTVYVSP